jgi:ubiquinone/menaquinone biosynthesis C-methylase UbiE
MLDQNKEDRIKYWNESSKKIPMNKDHSSYATEKEKLFPRNAVVCDLGGGTGVDALYFLQKGHKVKLLEISDYALNQASRKAEKMGLGGHFSTAQVDLASEDLPLDGRTFDVIYSRLVLHCFDSKRVKEILKQIVSRLKQNGVAYITLKSPYDEDEMKYLKQHAQEVEENVFLEEGGKLKSIFSKEQLEMFCKELDISEFEVGKYEESFEGRVDRVLSGNKKLVLNEIIIRK